jgi:hypothetical protein
MNMRRWIVPGVGMATGGLGGFLYWHYVGCINGTCAITSSPINSTLYGTIMGGLLFNIFSAPRKR